MEMFSIMSGNQNTRRVLSKQSASNPSKVALQPADNCYINLKRLGITPNYIGYHQVLCAVEVITRNSDALFSVTKNLYPAIAAEYGSSWKAVERNIRSAVSIAWKRNPALLQALAGYQMDTKPTAAQFLAILVGSR